MQMKLWQYLPRIKYNTPPSGTEYFFTNVYATVEVWFKFVGWCIVLATLHFGYVKTNSAFFLYPELILYAPFALMVYGYFMRFTIILPKGNIVGFNAGRPGPFHWPSF